ncbi:hypothetical protein P0J00_000594 [Vibrio vulnificus]|nr:hypothetical protein [Vibrio vulnificus]EKO5196672.1 hypothetical protein [Vibrio vulnificus]
MTWITLPSVSVQNGSKIVTVNNTQTTNIKVGDALLIGNYQPVEIAGVFATQLSLRTNWSNAAQANASAVVMPTFGDFNAATQALRQATQVTQGNFKTLEDWGTKLGNITFEGQDNSKHTARTLLQMDADVSELEEQANNLIVSLSGLNFSLSKAIVDVLRSRNKEQYSASGFIHTGRGAVPNAAQNVINEGMWQYTGVGSENRLYLGRNAAVSSVGTSDTPHPVMNIAGFTVHLRNINNTDPNQSTVKFQESPNGAVVSDSSGNCRGSGKPTLDLSKDVDPKYGDVADSVNEAVARAFEGELGNGDFRNGLTGWAFANGLEIISNHSVGVTRFNIKTAGNGQCNNDSANKRLVRGLKYKATIYVADSSGTFFLSTLKDSAIDQQHALKNGWNEIEFTMGDSLYPVRKGNAQAGQYIDIGFFSVTALTEEVVIERVDMAGLEFFKEKVGAYLYPYGMIQNKATTVDGVATTEDTIRPITYFAVFDGDTTSRGLGWKLADLTFVQLATIMSNPEHNAWYNEAGELMQFRGRQRSFAGLGNGDWRVNNPKGDILSFGTENLTRVAAQGRLDTPASPSGGGNFFAGYTFTAHNRKPEVGMFTLSANSGDYQAPDGECYFYVLATVPRLNQGAYHQSLNPMGTAKLWKSVSDSAPAFWHQSTVPISVIKDCFSQYKRSGTGNITDGHSGHPEGKLFDAIYPSGQGGVIDWRLPARDMSSKEEAAKIIQQVVNGTYRGLEKLWFTQVVDAGAANSSQVTNGRRVLIYPAYLGFKYLTDVPSSVKGYIVNKTSLEMRELVFATQSSVHLVGEAPWTADSYLVITQETPISVSGDFTQLDVIGSPAEILKTDALKNGWMGSWIPLIPDNTGKVFPASKKYKKVLNRVFTSDAGSVWQYVPDWTGQGADSVRNAIATTALPPERVTVNYYTAFAKQTKPSTSKPVLNGSGGIGAVWASAFNSTGTGGCLLAESLLGKVLTSNNGWQDVDSSLTVHRAGLTPSGTLNRDANASTEHERLTLAPPNNNSPAVKALWHQTSNNRQATLSFLWNELVFDAAWRTPDKVWSGGSVAVAAGETFRAESSSAYAVAGLLMRCVKAVTANATVLGAMHVTRTGEVISITDGLTYFKVVTDGWSDDAIIRIIDGVGTFNNENGDTCLYGISELAMPYGYTKNQAGAGKQVVGVDL